MDRENLLNSETDFTIEDGFMKTRSEYMYSYTILLISVKLPKINKDLRTTSQSKESKI